MYALESKNVEVIETVIENIQPDKRRAYLRTQSFDGNTAQKILDGLKSVLGEKQWQKIYDLLMCSEKDISVYRNGFM